MLTTTSVSTGAYATTVRRVVTALTITASQRPSDSWAFLLRRSDSVGGT